MSAPIGIAGLGLMGGSLALALARAGTAVLGFDPAAAVRAAASSRGLAIVDSPRELMACDLLFVAAPLGRLPEVFATLADFPGVVSDLGSTKGPVVRAGEGAFGGRFVGGHPMAGTEQVGFAGADADLLTGATWVLTPTPRTDAAAMNTVRQTLAPLGVRLIEMSPAAHDEGVAAISHLPYLVACALAETARRQDGQTTLQQLAAGGFRDTTRLAKANSELGRDMCLTNGDALRRLIPQLQAVLADWQARIAAGDQDGLDAALGGIADWRRAFDQKVTP